MAISPTVPTNRLLNAWQKRMGVNPYLFNQVAGSNAYANLAFASERAYVQPERDYIAEGLAAAQADILPYLRTFHRPTYVETTITLPRGYNPLQSLWTNYHWVQAIGERATTLIEADVAVTYDLNAGTATLNVTTAVDTGEIEVFFRVADGAQAAADPRYQIEPLRLTASGGVVTAVGHPGLFVLPSIWADPYLAPNYNIPNTADAADVNSYVEFVDVYRVYPDATNAVTIVQDPYFTGNYTGTTPNLITGGALLLDGRKGEIRLRADTAHFCTLYGVRNVRVKYLAGYPLDPFTQQPDTALEAAFIRLANCRVPLMPNTFSDQRAQVYQNDTAVQTVGEGFGARMLERETPFGYRKGEVESWRTINRSPYMVGSGGVLGAV